MDTEILNKFREFVKDFIETSASNIKAEDSLHDDKVIHEEKFDPGFGYITFTVLEVNDDDDIDAPLFKVFASDYNGKVGSSFKSFSRWNYEDKSKHLINVNQYVLDSMKQAVKNLSSKTNCRLLVDEIEKAINLISNNFFIVTKCDKDNEKMVEDRLITPLEKFRLKSGKSKEERDKEGKEEYQRLIRKEKEECEKMFEDDDFESLKTEDVPLTDDSKLLDSFHEFKKWAESQDPNADEYVIKKNSFLGKAVTSLVRGFLPDVDGFAEDDDDDELTLDIEKETEEEED